MFRQDDPNLDTRTDDDSLDEDAADRRRRRRDAVREATAMGRDPEAAGQRFDANERDLQIADAAVRANGTRRLTDAQREDGEIDEDASELKSIARLDGAWRGVGR